MWVLHVGLIPHLRFSKSPMGYIGMNLNISITFRARYLYNFTIHAQVFIFTNYKFDFNF